MPIYEYECSNCRYYLEVMQKISDARLRKCPSCGKNTLQKLISAPVFRLKGSGWYETDFKSDQEHKRNLAGAEKDDGGKPASSDAKSDAKTEAKGDSNSDAKPAEKASASGDAAGGQGADKTPAKTPAKTSSGSGGRSGRASPAARPVAGRSGGRSGRPA